MKTGSPRIVANLAVPLTNTIVKRQDGYHVVAEKNGKNLGGPYTSRGQAEKRLAQVEYFKHTSNVERSYMDVGHSAFESEKGNPTTAFSIHGGELRKKYHPFGNVLHDDEDREQSEAWGRVDHKTKEISVIFAGHTHPRRQEAIKKQLGKAYPNHEIHHFDDPSMEDFDLNQALLDAGMKERQRGYEQQRSEVGSGENQYPTGYPANPPLPQPLDETDLDDDSVTQSPLLPPSHSRYQQPWGNQNVGQGVNAGPRRKNAPALQPTQSRALAGPLQY